MRRMFIIILVTRSMLLTAQQNIFHEFTSWDDMKKVAQIQNRKIFLYFGATWCAPCSQIKRELFPDSVVQSKLRADFVSYEFDIDQKETIPFLKKYRISGVPLIIVLNSDGFVTDRISEIPMDISGFTNLLREASLNDQYVRGVTNSLHLNTPLFYNKYFDGGMKNFPDSAVVDSYLKHQKDLTTEVNWNVLTYFNTNDDYFYFIIENEDRLFDLYGMEVKFKKLDMFRRIAERYIQTKDSAQYNHIAKLLTGAADLGNAQSQEAFLMRQLLFLGRTGLDWPKFIEKSRLCIQSYGPKYIRFISQYALASKPDSATRTYLISILKPLIESKPNSDLYFMYGTLMWYSGSETTAEEYFEKTLSTSVSPKQVEFYREKIVEVKKR